MTTVRILIKAVLFQQGDEWVGQCLEHDIVAQAKSVKRLTHEIRKVIVDHIVVSKQEGVPPLVSKTTASARYWDMFKRGLPLQSEPFSIEFPQGAIIPEPELRLAT